MSSEGAFVAPTRSLSLSSKDSLATVMMPTSTVSTSLQRAMCIVHKVRAPPQCSKSWSRSSVGARLTKGTSSEKVWLFPARCLITREKTSSCSSGNKQGAGRAGGRDCEGRRNGLKKVTGFTPITQQDSMSTGQQRQVGLASPRVSEFGHVLGHAFHTLCEVSFSNIFSRIITPLVLKFANDSNLGLSKRRHCPAASGGQAGRMREKKASKKN